MAAPPASTTTNEEEIRALVASFEGYNFVEDADFRAGVPAVIRNARTEGLNAAEIDTVIGKAQWFYYTRKVNASVPFETYLQYRSNETESLPWRHSASVDGDDDAPPPPPLADAPPPADLSFNEVVQLIQAGRASEVPTIHVPNELNGQPASVSKLEARPKPWEKAEATSGEVVPAAPGLVVSGADGAEATTPLGNPPGVRTPLPEYTP
ncbi:uncharacterized protein LOC62_02G002876 [Vanrija pseudolonga]|uniref:Uncharacterized protein n=1 Tax=Vanrija pseudolonga TaxID=143232 RepID=A0AAF0Y2Z0_9TREE|nr:hypothetical protein LOC62_02G002876 [Vanrija pseudolonga]